MEPTPGIADRIAAESAYLYALAARRLRNRERSEDAAQGTLLAGLAGAHRYRGEASLRTWLTAIPRNRIVDDERARRREPLASDLDVEPMPGPGRFWPIRARRPRRARRRAACRIASTRCLRPARALSSCASCRAARAARSPGRCA